MASLLDTISGKPEGRHNYEGPGRPSLPQYRPLYLPGHLSWHRKSVMPTVLLEDFVALIIQKY